MKLIDEILWLYLVMKEETEGLLALSESLESFKRFIDIISVTEDYLKVIEGIEVWKALVYYQKGSVEINLTAWTVSQGILWKGQHLWLNISSNKADVKVYVFELLSAKEQEEFITNLGLHWDWWFVMQRNLFMRLFLISKFREYTFSTTESILSRVKLYFSSVTELWKAFWKNEINELQLIHLDLDDEGKASQLMLFTKLEYETAIRESDVVLDSAIDLTRLFNESASILHSHHESIFIEWVCRYLIRGEINDDQLYSLLTFLTYARNNLQLRHEYESYIEMNLKYNDHSFLPESELNDELMSWGKTMSREELNQLKVENSVYFFKLAYTQKDLAEEVLKFLEEHSELRLKAQNGKIMKCVTTVTPSMNEDMTLKKQPDLIRTDTETFQAYILVTDFSHVETPKSSLTSDVRKSTADKKVMSVKDILRGSCREKSSLDVEAGSDTAENIIVKTEKAFLKWCEKLQKRCSEKLQMSESKAAHSMIDDKKGIADILKSIMRTLTDIRFRNEVMINNIEGQHHYMKTLLKALQEKINKLTKGTIERAADNINDVKTMIDMIVNQMKLMMKVFTQYINDASLIQIQLWLIEDLKKAEYVVKAAKLLKIEADPSKFNKVRTFKKYAVQTKEEGTSKVK